MCLLARLVCFAHAVVAAFAMQAAKFRNFEVIVAESAPSYVLLEFCATWSGADSMRVFLVVQVRGAQDGQDAV